jgi:hypothetical protein
MKRKKNSSRKTSHVIDHNTLVPHYESQSPRVRGFKLYLAGLTGGPKAEQALKEGWKRDREIEAMRKREEEEKVKQAGLIGIGLGLAKGLEKAQAASGAESRAGAAHRPESEGGAQEHSAGGSANEISWWKRLLNKLYNSSELKPGWGGFSIDLKSLFRRKRQPNQ